MRRKQDKSRTKAPGSGRGFFALQDVSHLSDVGGRQTTTGDPELRPRFLIWQTPVVSDEFPGSLIIHPVALLSLALLLLNDHYLKEHFGGPVTGKLSDAAGIVFFPVLLVSLCEVVRRIVSRRNWVVWSLGLVICVVATGLMFALAKLWAPATAFYRAGTGVAEWPAYVVTSLFRGSGFPGLPSAHLVRDPTDLAVLPLLVLPLWIGLRRIDRISSRDSATHHWSHRS